MQKLKEAGVEVIRPEKSLFADKSKSVLEEITKDAVLKKLVQQIQSE